MKIYLANEIETDSIVDGEGLRIVVWFQGCSHNCFGCHNPHTHQFKTGIQTTTKEVVDKILTIENHNGVTLSGGDPLFQIDAALDLVKQLKRHKINIWSYTGFTYEEVLEMSETNPKYLEFLQNIDVLIDGKFKLEERSLNIQFRGSTNQRIINVKKSLKIGKVSCFKKYDYKKKKLHQEKKNIFV